MNTAHAIRAFVRPRLAWALALAAALGLGAVSSSAWASSTERVNVASDGAQANGESVYPAISADGRVVAFCSDATNLVSKDGNRQPDVFARERPGGITALVSVSDSGVQGKMDSNECAVSEDGRFVAFCSWADNLVPGDTNGTGDVFVHDRLAGATERVSVNDAGQQGNAQSGWFPVPTISISATGQFVGFSSFASNLAPGDTNGKYDVFVRDRVGQRTERVSVSSSGAQGNDDSWFPSISADGRFIAFSSRATNLVLGDTNAKEDVFVHDRSSGITERVSVSSSGGQATDVSQQPCISDSGRFVAFVSYAGNLVPGDAGHIDVFVHDRDTGATECASVNSAGQIGNANSSWPSISADGRWVAFASAATNLAAGDTNGTQDVFVRDLSTGVTERVSVNSAGQQGNGWSDWPSISGDGRCVAFRSWASNLVPNDTNGYADIFVRDRGALPPTVAINAGAGCTKSSAVTLSVACGDWIEMRFRNESGDWSAWEPCAPTREWALSPGDGMKTVCVQGRDVSLNESAETCDQILLDTTAPEGMAISINGDAACTDSAAVTLTLAASGAAEMRLRNETDAWSAWEPYATSKAWMLSAGRGEKSVGFQCRDACGNESGEVTAAIRIPSFDDVGCASSQWPYVEALARERIAGGCWANPPLYCPASAVTRAQMAKFICIAAGETWLDRATPTFADVPKSHWAYGYIERLADPESWAGAPPTSGCRSAGGARYYCPSDSVTRAQMAKFLCIATGKAWLGSTIPTFADVPVSHQFYGWIERLADPASWGGTAVASGCALGPPRLYCPGESVTRGQMAVFLVKAFSIAL